MGKAPSAEVSSEVLEEMCLHFPYVGHTPYVGSRDHGLSYTVAVALRRFSDFQMCTPYVSHSVACITIWKLFL